MIRKMLPFRHCSNFLKLVTQNLTVACSTIEKLSNGFDNMNTSDFTQEAFGKLIEQHKSAALKHNYHKGQKAIGKPSRRALEAEFSLTRVRS
jgi:hypothetical protein